MTNLLIDVHTFYIKPQSFIPQLYRLPSSIQSIGLAFVDNSLDSHSACSDMCLIIPMVANTA